MSAVYEAIGRAVVKFARIRIVSVLLGAYLAASRSVDEG
jgi:hypothetical protein